MTRPGDTLLLTFGHGTQIFRVTQVTPKGKPYGLRWNASRNEWQPAQTSLYT